MNSANGVAIRAECTRHGAVTGEACNARDATSKGTGVVADRRLRRVARILSVSRSDKRSRCCAAASLKAISERPLVPAGVAAVASKTRRLDQGHQASLIVR